MSSPLQLVYWDNTVLSTVCDSVEDNEFGPKLAEFAAALVAKMDTANGIGLAAPQVGLAKRIFAMHFPDGGDQCEPIVVCNPTLELSGDTLREREGCLSVPGVFEQVARADQV